MGLIPDLPRKGEADAPARRFMGRAALIWAVIALGLAMTGDAPADLPAWALEHKVVFRFMIWLALFAMGAFLLNVLALIFHGWLFTGFTAGPVSTNAEKVADDEEALALQEAISALTKVAVGVDELVEELHDRIVEVEGACEIEPPDTPPAKLAALREAEGEGEGQPAERTRGGGQDE